MGSFGALTGLPPVPWELRCPVAGFLNRWDKLRERQLLNRKIRTGALFVIVIFFVVAPLAAQSEQTERTENQSATHQPTGQQQSQIASQSAPASSLDDTLTAGEAGAEEPVRKLVSWNEYEGKYFTLRVGGGFLYEYAAYAQDDDSKKQFAMYPDEKLRDARILLKGRLKFFKRPVTYSMGIMYDAANDEWVARQTGIMVEVPEIGGYLFVGRTKEGFSMNKVMVGYAGWTHERYMMNDAIPILADGVKWFGHAEKQHLIWNLGIYKTGSRKVRAFRLMTIRSWVVSPGCPR